VASLSQGRTAAAQCGLFTHKSVPVIFEPPCILTLLMLFLNNIEMEFRERGWISGVRGTKFSGSSDEL